METMTPTQTAMSLNQAQHLAWLRQNPAPATSREALGRLLETARLSLEALDTDHIVTAQNTLEDVLIQTLVAMKTMSLQPDQALQRALSRMQDAWGKRAFHIFSDHVEIRVQDELRGEWPLYTLHEYNQALSLARELGCDVIHEEACQLGLFTNARFQSQPTHSAE
jgi:hypothetical protein